MKRFALALSVSALALSGVAQADIVTDDPYLIGPDRPYHADNSVQFNTAVGFFDIFIDLEMDSSPPYYGPPLGGTEIRESPSKASLGYSLNGLPPGVPWEVPSGLSTIQFTNIGSSGEDGPFELEMLALNLSGGTMPPGFMLRESPTLASTGTTTVKKPKLRGPNDGPFTISSFFDVFTELSIDGGNTWVPASGPVHLQLFPTPGAAALLGLGGLVAGRRRRA